MKHSAGQSRDGGLDRLNARSSISLKGTRVNINKDQIIQLLESQGNHDQAQQAAQQLPSQVDTENQDHVSILSKFGLDPGSLGDKLGGLGNLL